MKRCIMSLYFFRSLVGFLSGECNFNNFYKELGCNALPGDENSTCTEAYECPKQLICYKNDCNNVFGGKYQGWGMPPGHGYPQGPPGSGAPQMYPYGPGVVFYPVHPSFFYPQYPPPPDSVQVVDSTDEAVPEMPGETVELPYSTYRWVPACLSQKSIPMGALRVGTDADGEEIYAGRAHHSGNLLPAKVIPSKNACYVSFCGEEILTDQFEVLVPAMFSWQFATGGNVPPGAVAAGFTPDGEKLYYGRVNHDGCTTPGKIQQSHGVCYYPFGGEERSSAEYEVLVLF